MEEDIRYIKRVLRTSGREVFQSQVLGRITLSGDRIYSDSKWVLSQNDIQSLRREIDNYKCWWTDYSTNLECQVFIKLLRPEFKRSNEYYEAPLPSELGYKKVFILTTPRLVYVERKKYDKILFKEIPEDIQKKILSCLRLPF